MQELTRRSLLQGAAAVAGAAPLLGAQPAPGPSAAASQRFNVIHINVDTWGTGWLGCYGNAGIRTPGVDRLAEKSLRFLDAYAEALPTVPARRAIYTGRQVFPSMLVLQRDDVPLSTFRGWHQLYTEDVTMSETLRDAGYTTALLSDLYHQFHPDKNFHRGFKSWQWIRGQEVDKLVSGPRRGINLLDYVHPSQIAAGGAGAGLLLQYLMNRRAWRTEDDWPAARLFAEGERWLENNVEDNQPFYLHLESYSPHEMWDPPPGYYEMYMKSSYSGPRLIFPPDTTARMTPVEIEHVRALYAGLITFVDSRIGSFLAKVEQMGLLDTTVIVFVADHGIMMGEQGQFHKDETGQRTQLTHVPLLVHYPRGAWAGRRFGGLVQHTDLMPTLLDILGVGIPERVTGQSVKPLIDAGASSPREWIVGGWDNHGAIRSKDWLYIGRWNPGQASEQIYELWKDPLELTNVVANYPDLVPAFRGFLKAHVDYGWPVTKGTFATILIDAPL